MMMVDDDELRARARRLFGGTTTAGKEAMAQFQLAATKPGDPDRGRQVFARTCSVCHQYRGSGGAPFGPDLGEVRNRLPLALLTDILHPNQSIADGYELWIVELADGTTTAGVISAETPTSVTIRQQGGGDATIARSRVTAMRISNLSAMPEGLEAQMDVEQMADLIAFIRSER